MTEADVILQLKDVSVIRSARVVLDRFSMTVGKGETTVLLGEEDCGAASILRLCAGALNAGETASGEILYRGSDLRKLRRDTRIAFLPSTASHALCPSASAEQQLSRVVARKLRIPRAGGREELRAAYSHFPDAPPYAELRRKAGALDEITLAWGLLAAAVAQTPDLILADDPLSEIGPVTARKIMQALHAERARLGCAILYATRELYAPVWIGGKVIVLRRGHVVEEGPAEKLATSQTHAYTQMLFKSSPKLSKDAPTRTIARGETLLRVQGVHLAGASRSLHARDGISFELRRGASLALVGEEGSGRRALARALLGLERDTPGQIILDAVNLNVLSRTMTARLRRRVAFVTSSDDALDPRMTIHDTVDEPLRAHLGLSRELIAGHREAALKRVGLASHVPDRVVGSLPAFDKRRLQVARAIVSTPLLAVIDEPLRGLDAFSQAIMRDLLNDFRSQEGPAFLVITADFSVAQALADEAMVFKDLHLVVRGLIHELVRDSTDPTVRALIDASRPIEPSSLSKETSSV